MSDRPGEGPQGSGNAPQGPKKGFFARNPFILAVLAVGLMLWLSNSLSTASQVAIDYGDTDCKTPEAIGYIDKTWTHSLSKGYATPAAHEQSREPMRLRC